MDETVNLIPLKESSFNFPKRANVVPGFHTNGIWKKIKHMGTTTRKTHGTRTHTNTISLLILRYPFLEH